jgi:hypothetical protein
LAAHHSLDGATAGPHDAEAERRVSLDVDHIFIDPSLRIVPFG